MGGGVELPGACHLFLFCSEYKSLVEKCEETKEKFSEYEKQDVKCREDLKHAKAKSKKLDKSLEQEKKKVGTQVRPC